MEVITSSKEVISIKLTIYFEGAFWVGVFEKIYNNELEVSKVVFGAEPKDCEVYEFILKNFRRLQFTRSINVEETYKKNINPKRLKRKIQNETKKPGVSTKAQEAMKLEQEKAKLERKGISKLKKEELAQRKFELRQEKKKKKKKGH